MPRPKLFGVNLSPFVRKVRVALIEKGVEYELVPIIPFQLPHDFQRISPLGKIPVWQEDDGYSLPDSSAILAYLERVHPTPALYPADPRDLGRALFLEEYADTKLIEALSPVFQERFVKKLMNQEADEAVIERALRERIPPVFDYLEGQVTDARAIAGKDLSVADTAIASQILNFQYAGGQVDETRWPKLARYVAGILARPSFASLIEEERSTVG